MAILNLSPLNDQAREIVEHAATIYVRHTDPWFVGLYVHGDALRDRFTPGCSELQFRLFLEREAFSEDGRLPIELCVYIQRDLSTIDPAPFRRMCCRLSTGNHNNRTPGPVPGAYHVLAGRTPIPEATNLQLHEAATFALSNLTFDLDGVRQGLLSAGGARLAAPVEDLSSVVWETLYHVTTIHQKDGIRTWQLPKDKAIGLLPTGSELGDSIRTFQEKLSAFPGGETSTDAALEVIAPAQAFLGAVKAWWSRNRESAGLPNAD